MDGYFCSMSNNNTFSRMRWRSSLEMTASLRDVKIAQMKTMKILIIFPAKKTSDESSGSDNSEGSEWSYFNEVLQPNMNVGQGNTAVQQKKQFSLRNKPFETRECNFKGQSVTPPDDFHTPRVFQKVTKRSNKSVQCTKIWVTAMFTL